MATASSGISNIAALVNLLGGSRTTGSADTGALRDTIAQMQANNSPEGMQQLLASLFQQAAGQIPGMQAAFANSMGARRSGNSGVQAALSKLLAQTTLAAQAQHSQNLQAQAQAAAALANATRGSVSKTNLGDAAGNLLLLAGLSKGKDAFDKLDFGSMFGGSQTTPMAMPDVTSINPDLGASFAGPVLQPSATEFNYSPTAGGFDLNDFLSGGTGLEDINFADFDFGNFDFSGGGSVDWGAGAEFGGGGMMDDLFSMGVF